MKHCLLFVPALEKIVCETNCAIRATDHATVFVTAAPEGGPVGHETETLPQAYRRLFNEALARGMDPDDAGMDLLGYLWSQMSKEERDAVKDLEL